MPRYVGSLQFWLAVFSAVTTLAVNDPAVAGERTSVPLVIGLAVTAVNTIDEVDHEMVQRVVGIDDASVTFSLHRGGAEGGSTAEPVTVIRVVNRGDLQSASRLVAYFHAEDPELFPGSTAFQISSALLDALNTGEPVPFVLGAASGPWGSLGARKYFRGTLTRVELGPITYPVLLDGVRTEIPAIHASGTLKVGDDRGEAEFWFLNQPDNPLMLRGQFRGGAVRVVRIDVPASSRTDVPIAAGIETEACRGELTGVYFDSGSAELLPGSELAIADAAVLLADHGEWRVTVAGHTDSVGSEDGNQELSRQRASAVVSALVTAGIAADRLTAEGLGETRPIESNETVEGRARNRRVELIRQC